MPLPTPASAATASIVTFAGSQRANSASAAASTLRRFSRGVGALWALFAEQWEGGWHAEDYS